MSQINLESIEQLKSMFSNLYNFRYWKYRFRFVDMKYEEFEDDKELKLTVTVEVDTGDQPPELIDVIGYNGNPRKAYDWDNWTFTTSSHTLEFTIPLSDNQVLDLDGKSRVQINSARYEPLFRFYKSAVKINKCNNMYFNLDTDSVTMNNPNGYNKLETSITYLCYLFGVLEECFPQLDSKTYKIPADLDKVKHDEFMETLMTVEVPNKIRSKIAAVSKGAIQLTDKVDGIFLKTFISILMSDKKDEYNVHTPMDYNFMDAISGLVYEIQNEKINTLRQDIRYNFNKNGELYNKTLQFAINKYYHMQAEAFRDVQVVKDSNAVSILSQGRTIYFYTHQWDSNTESYTPWDKEQLELNSLKYFNGVLDPTRTRDSNLINYNNELALDTDIKGDDIFITVKDIVTNENIKLRYEDFILTKVLAEENYQEGKVVPNKIGKYTILQYENYTTYDTLPEDVKYARSVDNRLTYATGLIPFVNRMVSTRTLLASHFLDQSIPVVGAKPPVVHTDYNKRLYLNNPTNIKSKVKGTVIEVRDQFIKIEDEKGKVYVEGKEQFTETAMHTTNEFVPTVKVGDKVEPGTIISTSNSFVDGEFTTQVPLIACYGTYMAGEHEDGIILTESAAKKFGHVSLFHVVNDFKDNYIYTFIKNTTDPTLDQWSLAKKGNKVKRGDVLFRLKRVKAKTFKNHLAQTAGVTDVESFNTESLYETFEVRVPYNIQEGGIIESIRLYFNDAGSIWYGRTDHDTPCLNWDKNQDVYDAYNYFTRINTTEDREWSKFLGKKITNTYEFDSDSVAMHLEVRIKYINTMGKNRLGGKLSNFYASKGVNTEIIPDEYAPIVKGVKDENGNPLRVECFISSLSTYSRTNPGQIDEVKLGMIGMQTWIKLVKNGDPKNPKTIKFLDLLYPNGWNWKQLQADGKKYGYVRIEVKHFDTYYNHDLILKLLKMLGLGNGDYRIILPAFNNKETEYPCTVGITSMMRLHFIQEAKSSYTAEGSISISEPSDNIGYQNLERYGGQKIGSQEIWAAAAHGILDVIEKNAQKNDNKRAQLHSAAILLGLKLTDGN